jgi:hypothetical protein
MILAHKANRTREANIQLRGYVMNAECPNLEKCPMFKHFQTDFAKQTYISLFCRGKFVECERKKLKDGCREVPEKLLPDGHYL